MEVISQTHVTDSDSDKHDYDSVTVIDIHRCQDDADFCRSHDGVLRDEGGFRGKC